MVIEDYMDKQGEKEIKILMLMMKKKGQVLDEVVGGLIRKYTTKKFSNI